MYFNTANYSVNKWDLGPGQRSYHYASAWNAGVTSDGTFFMEAGGSTRQDSGVTNPGTFSKRALETNIENDHKPEYDDKYYTKYGAEFAQGFLAGARVGNFDVLDLYQCLEGKTPSKHFFQEATMELRRGISHEEGKDGIKGLDTLVKFVVDMAKERSKTGQACPVISAKPEAWRPVVGMVKALMNEDTTLLSREGHLYFNGRDITKEGRWMSEAFDQSDFKKLG